jgi:hypothetical protein
MAAARATLRLLRNLPKAPPEVKIVSTQGHFEALFADYATARRGEGPENRRSPKTPYTDVDTRFAPLAPRGGWALVRAKHFSCGAFMRHAITGALALLLSTTSLLAAPPRRPNRSRPPR